MSATVPLSSLPVGACFSLTYSGTVHRITGRHLYGVGAVSAGGRCRMLGAGEKVWPRLPPVMLPNG